MIFTRVGILVVFLTFLNYEILLSNAQKCNACQPRDFNEKTQACACPKNQFCNQTDSKCRKCDGCFHNWDKVINHSKGEIEIILKNLIKRYETNLDELRKVLKLLSESVDKRENELKAAKNSSDQVDKDIKKLSNDLKKIQEDLGTAEEKRKQVYPISQQDLEKYLKEVKNAIETLLKMLKKFKFEDIDDKEALELVNKVKNMNSDILDMNKNFPKILQDSLNLALAIESDIDLFNSVITKYTDEQRGEDKFPHTINETTKWIEKDLLWLFNILNNYQNMSINTEELYKNASSARLEANKMKSELDRLVRNHENFEKLLEDVKKEKEFYKEVKDLLRRLKALGDNVNNYRNFYKKLMNKLTLETQLKRFLETIQEFNEKEEFLRKYKPKMDALLDEKNDLLKEYETITNVKSIDDLGEDIEKIIKEIEKIQEDITNHCSSREFTTANNTVSSNKTN